MRFRLNEVLLAGSRSFATLPDEMAKSEHRSTSLGVAGCRCAQGTAVGSLCFVAWSGYELAESLHVGGDPVDRALHGLVLVRVEARQDPSADEAGRRDAERLSSQVSGTWGDGRLRLAALGSAS
jgi:hypothetical protein